MFLLSTILLLFQFTQYIGCVGPIGAVKVNGTDSSPLHRDFNNNTRAPSEILFIPQDFHTLFVFFSSNVSTYPKDDDPIEKVFDFIENSIPFRFKSFYQLMSYFIIAPKIEKVSKVRGGGEISGKPLLGLFFEENVNRGMSGDFWDSMTNNWIEADLLNVLIHSTFCTLSTNISNSTGYCIEITKDNRLDFFPIGLDKLADDLLKDLKASSSKVKQPHSFKIQVHEILNPSDSKNSTALGNVIVDDESWRKQANSIAGKAKLKIQTKLIENLVNSRQKVQVRSIPFKEFGIVQNPRTKSYSQVLVPNDKMLQSLGYKMNGKFMKREELAKIMASSSQEPCAPITWYNVFHNSVFGNPKMCSPDDAKST